MQVVTCFPVMCHTDDPGLSTEPLAVLQPHLHSAVRTAAPVWLHLASQDWFLQRVQTYLYVSGFILLEHKAEHVGVRTSEQTKVERAVSNGEFLEEHCKQKEGLGARLKRGQDGAGLGMHRLGRQGKSHGSSHGCGPGKAVVAQSPPFPPFGGTASIPVWQSLALFPSTASSKGRGAVGRLPPITVIRRPEPRVCLSCMEDMCMELGTVGVGCLVLPRFHVGSSMNPNTTQMATDLLPGSPHFPSRTDSEV